MKNQNHILFLRENEPLDFSHIPDQSEVIVIVPSEKILLLEVEMPPVKIQQLRQVLPFALEEQLIEEVTQLHFAIGKFSKTQKVPVAIVAKNTLEQWLSILKESNIFPKMLIPDIFALPFDKEKWHLRFNNQMVAVRQNAFKGFRCDTANLQIILQHAQIEHLHIHQLQGEDLPVDFKPLISTQTQITAYSPEDFLKLSTQCIEEFPTINLLQGEYKPVKKSIKNYKWRWLTCAILFVLTGSILLCSKLITCIILTRALATNNQEITKIYKNYFPNSVAVIAPRLRLEEKLKKLSPVNHQSVFLYLLQLLGSELSKEKSIQLNSFNFENNQLIITITTTSFDDLDFFIKKLQNENLKVKQQKAQSIDSTVTASLLIQRGLI